MSPACPTPTPRPRSSACQRARMPACDARTRAMWSLHRLSKPRCAHHSELLAHAIPTAMSPPPCAWPLLLHAAIPSCDPTGPPRPFAWGPPKLPKCKAAGPGVIEISCSARKFASRMLGRREGCGRRGGVHGACSTGARKPPGASDGDMSYVEPNAINGTATTCAVRCALSRQNVGEATFPQQGAWRWGNTTAAGRGTSA